VTGPIVVDYEELRRMSRVWGVAARSLAEESVAVAACAAEPCIATNAAFDPMGAARSEMAILAAAAIPHGLAAMSAKLAADGLTLEAVVLKEEIVDDFPIRELAAFDDWLTTAAFRLPIDPGGVWRDGSARIAALGDAGIGYLSPFLEPLLALLAPSAQFRSDVAASRTLRVDPLLGLPLAAVGVVAPEGPGYVVATPLRPAWSDTAIGALGSAMRRVSDLEHSSAADLAIERVVAADGTTRWVVELPGMRHMGVSGDPQDLSGSVAAMALPATAYTRSVAQALDAAGVPQGAPVLLVGHSEGGIVAMDLAADPAFNGGRVRVTHVVAAGSPISSKQVAPGSGTAVLSVENVNDVVTHLDAVAAAPETPQRLTYQFSADAHDVVQSHDAEAYGARIEALDDSPNPLWRGFADGVTPYLHGATSTFVFNLADGPPT
jgi:hypothetical protein